jgi:hypothetical protein
MSVRIPQNPVPIDAPSCLWLQSAGDVTTVTVVTATRQPDVEAVLLAIATTQQEAYADPNTAVTQMRFELRKCVSC